jgi:hypothetical protein
MSIRFGLKTGCDRVLTSLNWVVVIRIEVEMFRAHRLARNVVAVGVPRRIKLRESWRMLLVLFPLG